jgi:hypothetical protein
MKKKPLFDPSWLKCVDCGAPLMPSPAMDPKRKHCVMCAMRLKINIQVTE